MYSICQGTHPIIAPSTVPLKSTSQLPVEHLRLVKMSEPSWKKATDIQKDSYKTALEQHLRNLEFRCRARHCKNVNCQSENHQNQIDSFLKGILESINSSTVNCLPSAGCSDNPKKTKTRFSSWQEDVQPFKDTSMFWHSIWLSAGRPLNTELHIIMS